MIENSTLNTKFSLHNSEADSRTNTGNTKKIILLAGLAIATVVLIAGTIFCEAKQILTENDHQMGALQNATITHLSRGPLTSWVRSFVDEENGEVTDYESYLAMFKDRDFNFPLAITGCTGYFPHEICYDYISRKIGIETEADPEVLLQNGYTAVTNPVPDDVVFYFQRYEGRPFYTHIGVVSDVNPFQVWVDSKWGIYGYCQHLVSAVPHIYGDEVVYLRKSLDTLASPSITTDDWIIDLENIF